MHGLLRDALQAELRARRRRRGAPGAPAGQRLVRGRRRHRPCRAARAWRPGTSIAPSGSSWRASPAVLHERALHDGQAVDRVDPPREGAAEPGAVPTARRWPRSAATDAAALGCGSGSASMPTRRPDEMSRLGSPADLRSTTNTGPVRPALDDAAAAYHGLPAGHLARRRPASPTACGRGRSTTATAVAILAEGAEEAAVLGAPAMEAYCTAMLGADRPRRGRPGPRLGPRAAGPPHRRRPRAGATPRGWRS